MGLWIQGFKAWAAHPHPNKSESSPGGRGNAVHINRGKNCACAVYVFN